MRTISFLVGLSMAIGLALAVASCNVKIGPVPANPDTHGNGGDGASSAGMQ